MPDPAKRAEMLKAWLLAQPLEGYEKSLKMSEKSLLDKRFLAGMPVTKLPPAQLFALCGKLDMPADLVRRLNDDLAGADTVHFGYEQGNDSAIFKLYLEYWKRLDPALAAGDESFVLHQAFKWDALDSTRRTVATYRCFPRLVREQILQRIAGLYVGQTDHPSFVLAARLMDLVATRNGEPPMYLEVSEENNPRASFDLNFHAAELKLADIEASAMDMAQRYSIPPSQFLTAWNGIAAKTLGHLSGGLSRDGQDFLTIYYDPLS